MYQTKLHYYWEITHDSLHDPGDPYPTEKGKAYGNVGLKGRTGEPVRFRVLDDDDNVYFSGNLWTDDRATGFEPLNHYMNDAGCTSIQYREKKDGKVQWVTL